MAQSANHTEQLNTSRSFSRKHYPIKTFCVNLNGTLKTGHCGVSDLLERPMRHMTALRVDLASCEISTLRSIDNEEQTASVTI